MAHGPRLEAPGTLHHVMVRGIERTAIFRDRWDWANFLERLAAQVTRHGLTVSAWALLPNHAHLLLRTGAVPLARPMRSLLTGYAGAFNRRHPPGGPPPPEPVQGQPGRGGALLPGAGPDLHVNPLRARVVPDLQALEHYPYCGHGVLLGRRAAPWQDTAAVVGRFAPRPAPALAALPALIARAAARWTLPPAALTRGARRRPMPAARSVVCALACTALGLPAASVARALGVSGPAVLQAIPRGQALVAAQPAAFQALVRAVLRGGH